MSLWKDYIKERLGKEMLEVESGFATYIFDFDKKMAYVEDVYVRPECRNKGIASGLLKVIEERSRGKELSKIYVTVVPGTMGSTESMIAILKYGFKLDSSANNLVVFVKEL